MEHDTTGGTPSMGGPVGPENGQLDGLRERLLGHLTRQLDLDELKRLPDDRRADSLRAVVETLLRRENTPLTDGERHSVVQDVLDEILGLGPLEKLLRDPTNSDILINGPHEVFVEQNGKLKEAAVRFRDADHLLQIIERIVSRVGRRIDDANPLSSRRWR